MRRTIIMIILVGAAAIFICAFCAFADTIYVIDGRVISGDIQEETLDYITIFEPDTLWRIVVYKHLIDRVEKDGVVYDEVKRGRMLRPVSSSGSQTHIIRAQPAVTDKLPIRQPKPGELKKEDSSPEEKKGNPIIEWFKRLMGGSAKEK